MNSPELTIPVVNRGVTAKQCGGVILHPGMPMRVPLSFLAQFGFDRDLQFDYSEFKAQMQVRDELGRFTFDWWCPLSTVDGYGRHALALFKGFNRLGVVPWLHSDGWGVDRLYLPTDIEAAKYASMHRLPTRIGAMMTLPYHVYDTQNLLKIIVTQFETDHIPEKHVANVNKLDHLIVTSSFQPKVWRSSGCKIPISVMTPGVDTEVFNYKERPKDGKFKILIVGALTGRKNPEGAIRIFQAASGGNPDWRLTIKGRKTHNIRQIQSLADNDSRIQVVVNDTHPDQIVQLYHSHDVFLWPSKGEGVGLPPLEAMSTGMEVVSSDNSGMADFIKDDVAYPIKTARTEPANIPGSGFSPQYTYNYGSVGNWWVPDESEGAKQLQKCFDNWLKGKGKGLKAAKYVRENHTLEIQAASVLKVLMKYE